MRIVTLANCFNIEGYDVASYGFSDEIEFDAGVKRVYTLDEALDGRNIVITGLPVSNDDITISAPFFERDICIDEVLKKMTKEQILIGGKISDEIKKRCKIHNVSVEDYLKREEFAVLNAIPTAEGAIELAMSMLPVTIHNSRSLVLGFGRIGKVLAKDLKSLGAKTYVEARRFDDLSWINTYGYEGIYLPHLKEKLPYFDVIFNTIPYQILTEDMMKYIRKDCLIIDLSSLPGGIDDRASGIYGLKVVHALSLPGKVAPKTAGEIIKITVQNIMSDLEV